MLLRLSRQSWGHRHLSSMFKYSNLEWCGLGIIRLTTSYCYTIQDEWYDTVSFKKMSLMSSCHCLNFPVSKKLLDRRLWMHTASLQTHISDCLHPDLQTFTNLDNDNGFICFTQEPYAVSHYTGGEYRLTWFSHYIVGLVQTVCIWLHVMQML